MAVGVIPHRMVEGQVQIGPGCDWNAGIGAQSVIAMILLRCAAWIFIVIKSVLSVQAVIKLAYSVFVFRLDTEAGIAVERRNISAAHCSGFAQSGIMVDICPLVIFDERADIKRVLHFSLARQDILKTPMQPHIVFTGVAETGPEV